MVERLRRAITPKTRVVGLTWVHSSTGLRLPIRSLAEVVQAANKGRSEADRCLLILDGVHGFGCSDEDVAALGADFVAASTHKWIFGPRGTGLVWGGRTRGRTSGRRSPTFDSHVPIDRWMAGQPPDPRTQAAFVSPGGFCAFEHCWGVEAAFELHERLGRERVTARVAELNGRFCSGARGHEERHAAHAARPEAQGRHRLLRGEGPDDGTRRSRVSRPGGSSPRRRPTP